MGKNNNKKAVLENPKNFKKKKKRSKEEIDVEEEEEEVKEKERTELCVRSSHKMMSSSKIVSLIYSKLE